MIRLLLYWETLRTSLWFVPFLLIAGAILLALGLIEVDVRVDSTNLQDDWPRLFGSGAEGSRGMLSAIASSMITVAGVVFSITMVALVQASSQYTSRVLRNFMGDRANQVVLGTFVGIYVYCLIVLRTIRTEGAGKEFVPSFAVLMAVLLALGGISSLIFFVHHIAATIQAESIAQAATQETIEVLDRLYPADAEPKENEIAAPDDNIILSWQVVGACRSGYVQTVDRKALTDFATEHETVVRMETGIGEFVVEEAPLAYVASKGPLDAQWVKAINGAYVIGHRRTKVQDVGFGIRQLVDIALKALSPGINDTTTAVICVDYLTTILARLAPRPIAVPNEVREGKLRLIIQSPTFESYLQQAFDQIRRNAEGNVTILLSLLHSLKVIAGRTPIADRHASLREQAALIMEIGARTVPAGYDRAKLDEAMQNLECSFL